jgi:hypothetical protein
VWVVTVTAMLLLPLVRMFTAGGGLIPPVSWVGLGIAAGFLVYRRDLLMEEAKSRGARIISAGTEDSRRPLPGLQR